MPTIALDHDQPRQVRAFLELPFQLYREVPQWVPPLQHEARLVLDRRRHPFYRHSEAAFFLAQDHSGRVLGRVAVIENRRYNDYNQTQTAFFSLFECQDDAQVARELLSAASDWARQRGLSEILGPMGFTLLDGAGLLVRGFEHRPAYGQPYHLPYYASLIEAAGFETHGEAVSGYLHRSLQFPERIHELAERIRQRRGLEVRRFRTRRELRLLVPHLKDLYNGALGEMEEGVPLTDAEAQGMANQLLIFADPRLVKVVMKGEQAVGFLFAYPDVSAAIQRCQGRLWPLGWLDVLLELRRTPWVNINGAGMLPEYRGLGGTAILFSELHKSFLEGGFEHAILVHIGVENDRMQRELRDLGVDFRITHRTYRLEL